ncbi:MAG TPA: DUF4159 domain-containing protein [Vicinamibacterales bacterium]|nr:DUF4159 domain-containing protein [Vicinamibacterales bacterium]
MPLSPAGWYGPAPWRRRAAASAIALLLIAAAAYGEGQWRFREGRFPPRFAPPSMPDANFTFCRIMYERARFEPMGVGWSTDYPFAEINLLTRLSELTRTQVSRDADLQPNHWVVRLTDDALFNCPFAMASDAGTIGLTTEEASRLREYLLKGGFLWVDDFWGTAAWEHWKWQIERVLPPSEFPITDVPPDDPIFRSQFHVAAMPQITNIQFWRGVGGTTTSERGADSDESHFRVIRDRAGRIMVVMTHNTDIADSWEREGEDPAFFRQFSPDGYAFGINVVLHAVTH